MKKDLKLLRDAVEHSINYSEEGRVGKVFMPIYKDRGGAEYVVLTEERALIVNMNVIVSRMVSNNDVEKLEDAANCGLSNMAAIKEGHYEFGYFVAKKDKRVIIELS